MESDIYNDTAVQQCEGFYPEHIYNCQLSLVFVSSFSLIHVNQCTSSLNSDGLMFHSSSCQPHLPCSHP